MKKLNYILLAVIVFSLACLVVMHSVAVWGISDADSVLYHEDANVVTVELDGLDFEYHYIKVGTSENYFRWYYQGYQN